MLHCRLSKIGYTFCGSFLFVNAILIEDLPKIWGTQFACCEKDRWLKKCGGNVIHTNHCLSESTRRDEHRAFGSQRSSLLAFTPFAQAVAVPACAVASLRVGEETLV